MKLLTSQQLVKVNGGQGFRVFHRHNTGGNGRGGHKKVNARRAKPVA